MGGIRRAILGKDHVPSVDFLKLRGSYGEIGNDKIGNFSYLYQQRYNYVPNSEGWLYYFGETHRPSGAWWRASQEMDT